MNGTLSASLFSCRPDRQERRPSRSRRIFRKTAACGKRAYWPINTAFPAKSRTTNEGPFGEVILQTGPMSTANPIRFSTKYDDNESDLLYYGYRYYDASAGRWLGRDPSEEFGGINLYGFAANDSCNGIDNLGLWKIKRQHSNWALAQCEGPQDTPQSLATRVHLDFSEFNLWARPANGGYYIPNTVIVYTSITQGSENRWPMSWQIANYFRKMAVTSGHNYEQHGYKVSYYTDRDSDDLFTSLWRTDGIAAFAFGGHGADDDTLGVLGYVAQPNPSGQNAVDPLQCAPPYHLQAIGAYCCVSALPTRHSTPIGPDTWGKWIDLISKDGTFVGYSVAATWLNVWWNQVAQNPGVIP